MHRKKSGAYILKPHQLADARHKTLADTLQHAAPRRTCRRRWRRRAGAAGLPCSTYLPFCGAVTRQLGLGHGAVIQGDPPVVCALHPQHGVTLWSSTPDSCGRTCGSCYPAVAPPPPRRWPPPPPRRWRDMDGAARVGAARGAWGARRAGGGPRRAAGGAAGDLGLWRAHG